MTGGDTGTDRTEQASQVRAEADRAEPRLHYLAWSRSGKSAGWRYLLATLLVVVAWVVGTGLPGLFLDRDEESPSPHVLLAVLTGSFAVGFVAVLLVVRRVLRRPWWSVVTGRWPGPVRHFALGAGIAVGSTAAIDLLITPFAPVHVAGVDPGMWLPLAAVGVIGFFVQTGFEELVFRGLLMQTFARRTLRASVVIGVPAAGFALIHWGNLAPYSGMALQVAPYLLIGLTWGWAAWYSGSLWLPWGLHWANNMYVTLVVTSHGDVLPTGGLLVRELTSLPLEVHILTTALTCALQVVAVRRWVPRCDLPGRQSVGTLSHRVPGSARV